MYQSEIYQLSYQALLLILILSGPPIIISMTLGLFVAIFQAATQIQEQNPFFYCETCRRYHDVDLNGRISKRANHAICRQHLPKLLEMEHIDPWSFLTTFSTSPISHGWKSCRFLCLLSCAWPQSLC